MVGFVKCPLRAALMLLSKKPPFWLQKHFVALFGFVLVNLAMVAHRARLFSFLCCDEVSHTKENPRTWAPNLGANATTTTITNDRFRLSAFGVRLSASCEPECTNALSYFVVSNVVWVSVFSWILIGADLLIAWRAISAGCMFLESFRIIFLEQNPGPKSTDFHFWVA